MSEHDYRVLQEEDRVEPRPVLVVGAITIVVFLLGVLWAWRWFDTQEAQAWTVPAGTEPQAVGREVGYIEQTLVDQENVQLRLREAAQRRLDSWGWVDQGKGVVRIPIDEAMNVVVEGARP